MYQNPFDGRMSRQNFIYGQILLLVAILAVSMVIFKDGITFYNVQNIIPLLVIGSIPQVMLVARRLHDINISALWSFMILVPYLSLIFAVYVSAKAGDAATNRFGAPDNRPLFDSILNKE